MSQCNLGEDERCAGENKCCMGQLKCVKERPGQFAKCIRTDWDVMKIGDKKYFIYKNKVVEADGVDLRAVLKEGYTLPSNKYEVNNIVVIKDGSDDDLKTGKITHILNNDKYIVDLYKASNVQPTIFAHHEIAPISEVSGYVNKYDIENEEALANSLSLTSGELVPTHDNWMLTPNESEYNIGGRKRKTRRLKKKSKKAKKTNRKIKKKKRRSRTRTRKRSKGRKKTLIKFYEYLYLNISWFLIFKFLLYLVILKKIYKKMLI